MQSVVRQLQSVMLDYSRKVLRGDHKRRSIAITVEAGGRAHLQLDVLIIALWIFGTAARAMLVLTSQGDLRL